MTQRMLSAIIFSAIIILELFFYLSQGDITTPVQSGEAKGIFTGTEYVRNVDAEKERDTEILSIIVVTVIVGVLITFNLPNKKIRKDK